MSCDTTKVNSYLSQQGKVQESVNWDKVGQRSLYGKERKQWYRILNHILCGHSQLSLSDLCVDLIQMAVVYSVVQHCSVLCRRPHSDGRCVLCCTICVA